MSRGIVIILQIVWLSLGAAGLAYYANACWRAGYRTEDWSVCLFRSMGVFLLLILWLTFTFGICMCLVSTILRESKHRLSRMVYLALVTALFVVVATLLWNRLGTQQFDAGEQTMQSEINPRQLAEDCLALIKTLPPEKHAWLFLDELHAAIAFSPSIQRLRPSNVGIDPNSVIIELFGGFDHYGYRLLKTDEPTQWQLEWYTESTSRVIYSITVPVQ